MPAFAMILIAGLCGIVYAFIADDGWMLVCSTILAALGGSSIIVVGNDPLLMNAFCVEVNKLRGDNKRLASNNNDLEARLDELGRVQGELTRVSAHLDQDLLAAQMFLEELEKVVMLQQVADVLSLYFTVTPEVFVSSLTVLMDLVPSFEFSRLAESVQRQGLSLEELAVLLDTLIADDPVACRKELELLCRRGELKDLDSPVSVYLQADKSLPASTMASTWQAEQAEVALVPFLSLGCIRIYSFWHFVVVIALLLACLLSAVALARMDLPSIACSLLGLALAGGLALHGELLATVQVLREQMKELRLENNRFTRSNDRLAVQVAFLLKLERGYDKLQAEFGGDIEKAHELIMQKNAAVKTSAIAVVTHLFVRADQDRNGVLDEEEAELFVKSLQLVFHSLPDFDVEAIRKSVSAGGLKAKQVVPLVELIVGAERAKGISHIFPLK